MNSFIGTTIMDCTQSLLSFTWNYHCVTAGKSQTRANTLIGLSVDLVLLVHLKLTSLEGSVRRERAGEPEVVAYDDTVHPVGRDLGPGSGTRTARTQDVLLARGSREV